MRYQSACLVLLALMTCLAMAAQAEIRPVPVGYAQIVRGDVFAMNEDPAVLRENDRLQLRRIAKDSPLYISDVIIAGEEARCQIMFEDGMTLVVGEGSSIALSEFSYDFVNKDENSLIFNMGPGLFRFITGKIVERNAGAFAMETPLGVLGIRGTEVLVDVRILEVDVNDIVNRFAGLGDPEAWRNPDIDFKNEVNRLQADVPWASLFSTMSDQEVVAHLSGDIFTPVTYTFRTDGSSTDIPMGELITVTPDGPGALQPVTSDLFPLSQRVRPDMQAPVRAEFLSRYTDRFSEQNRPDHSSSCSSP